MSEKTTNSALVKAEGTIERRERRERKGGEENKPM
jgi:hypothetical protein